MAKSKEYQSAYRAKRKAAGGISTIQNQLASNKVDLDYANMKYSEAAKALNYTNSRLARDQFDMWDKERRRLQSERMLLESVPKINNPAGIPDNAITEQEFLASRGVGDSVSGYGVDRIGGANMTRMSERQRTAAKADIARGQMEYQQRRNEARAEYKSLVDKGILRDKTTTEKIITRAHGNPDNESTKAARRMAQKKGINWRTGKRITR